MNFNTCIDSCNYLHGQDIEPSHHPPSKKDSLLSSLYSHLLPVPENHLSFFFFTVCLMFIYNVNKRKMHTAVLIAFALGYVSISTYNIISSGEIIGVLPALAAMCYCMCLVQEKPSVFRIWGALNPSFWLAYDLMTRSYVMFFVHLGILISTLVAMIRLDGFLGIVKKNK